MATWIDRTQTGGDRQVFTWSAWVKITGNLATYNHLATTNSNPGNWDTFRISNNRNFQIIMNDNANQITTNRVFRDTNAWYHFVVAVDTTQSTASDRVKLYVNGIQETSFSTNNPVSQNHNTNFNTNGKIFRIGDNTWSTGSEWFSGLMSDVNFADGNQYSASTFGSTDPTTGQWKINTDPTFTLGTNGFTILKNGNTITDQSTNSNNFTLGSGTLTKTEDCPSNVFATGNPLIGRSSSGTNLVPALSNGNLTALADGSTWQIFKSTLGASSGKYYAEFKWISDSNTRYAYVGIYDEDNYANKVTGYPYMSDIANSVGYYSENGVYYTGGSSTSFGNSYSSNNIIGCAVDLDNNKLYFSKDGSWQGGGNPTNGTGGISITANRTYTFGLQLYAVGSIVFSANFGNGFFGTSAVADNSTATASTPGVFNYDVPTGYQPLSTKGLNA